MKDDLLEKIFRALSILVGFGVVLIATPSINEFYLQQSYAYFTGKVITIFSSIVIGIVIGVIFYLSYFAIRKLIEKIKSKK